MTEEQTEEIRGLIVALSSTNEETFKYKGSTYAKDATTASTFEVPSLKRAAEKKHGHREIIPIVKGHECFERYPAVKHDVEDMQSVLDSSPFADIIGVVVLIRGQKAVVCTTCDYAHRSTNRLTAYSESYERIKDKLRSRTVCL